ncbi:hypothetical protein ANCCAN_21174, partial [Ancylostoma caninum]
VDLIVILDQWGSYRIERSEIYDSQRIGNFKVNTLLSREMKTFIKTAACFPHRITDDMRASVMKDFKMSEKIHVMLLIMEARLQASLLYFTRALTNHYSQAQRAIQPKRLD